MSMCSTRLASGIPHPIGQHRGSRIVAAGKMPRGERATTLGYVGSERNDGREGRPCSAPLCGAVAGMSEMFALPAGFPGMVGAGKCRAVAVSSGRRFGAFAEKTLVCDPHARDAIDQLCWQGGFTQAWAEPDSQGEFTMTKIPAIILVKLMLGLGADQQAVVESLVGAYAICMEPRSKPHLARTASPTRPPARPSARAFS